jgi:hypothetical protein
MEIFAQVRGKFLSEGIQDFTANEATKGTTIVSIMEKSTEYFGTSVHHNSNGNCDKTITTKNVMNKN